MNYTPFQTENLLILDVEETDDRKRAFTVPIEGAVIHDTHGFRYVTPVGILPPSIARGVLLETGYTYDLRTGTLHDADDWLDREVQSGPEPGHA